MKRHIGLISVLTVLAAVLFLPVLISCNDRGTQLRQALAAADSLMKTDPQAALDTLLTIDSADAARLPRADRALYTLLRTEAEYKCYLPVAGNTTAISEAVDYYRRKGPEDRLARALTMQGAVLTECGDPDGAMLAYKEAEPLIERSGDLEQLGLLHTRIGELYQTTFSNTAETVYRYRKALECFEAGNYEHRLAAANLTLSRILLTEADSTALWEKYYRKGTEYAIASHDTLYIIESINQSTLFCLICAKDSLRAARIAVKTLLNNDYTSYLSPSLFNSFCQIAAEGYTGSEKTDSSLLFAGMMRLDNIVDSMNYCYVLSEIMEARGDFDMALDYGRRAYELESTINRESDVLNLSAHEHEIQSSYERMLGRHRISILVLAVVLLASAMAVLAFLYSRTRNSLKCDRRKIKDNLNNLPWFDGESHTDTYEDDELERMFAVLRKNMTKDRQARSDIAEITKSLLSMTNEMLKFYGKYKDGDTFRRCIDRLVADRLSPDIVKDKVMRTVNAVYPGFLDGARVSCPRLTENDIFIIALISCGFDNESMCLLTKVRPESLMVYKSRIAAKMGLNGKLTQHIVDILSSHLHKNT